MDDTPSVRASNSTVWVDVEDLFHYARHNPRPSGVQRLAFEIQKQLHARMDEAGHFRFVRHAGGPEAPLLREITWAEVEAQFARLSDPSRSTPAATPLADSPRSDSWMRAMLRRGGRFAYKLPPDLREPLIMAWLLQKRAALEFRAILKTEERPEGIQAGAKQAGAAALPPSAPAIQPDDVFLVLGSPWVYADFAGLLRALKARHGMRVALLLYDLIPVLHPEWCARDLVLDFARWLATTLPLCDVLLSISHHTAREVESLAARQGLKLASPVRPIPIGSGFGERPSAIAHASGLPHPGTYVLFVSTLEARKNHALLVRVWRLLLEEEERGLRSPGSVPELVFAGRVGWLVSDLLQQLENASWLGGRVRLLQDPSDAELRALYEGCLFTIFPSLYEGWGLPVTEALALGAPVLCSSAAALPEAGGRLARYFDPDDAGGCRRAVAALLDHPEDLAAWRTEVRNLFRPTPWSETAEKVVEALTVDRVEMRTEAVA